MEVRMNLTLEELALVRAYLKENSSKKVKDMISEVESEMLDLITPVKYREEAPARPLERPVAAPIVKDEPTYQEPVEILTEAPRENPVGGYPTPPPILAQLRASLKNKSLPNELKPMVDERRQEEPQLRKAGFTDPSIIDYILTGNIFDLKKRV